MCAKAKEATADNAKRGKRGHYNSSLQTLLDIWNVLAMYATPEKPMTAGQIAKYMGPKESESAKKVVNQSYLQEGDADESNMTSKQRLRYQAAAKPQTEDSPKRTGEKKPYASVQTVDRYLPNVTSLINTIFPNTVLHEEGRPAILHTYNHQDALHVVMEKPTGEPWWEGEMNVILTENPINPVPKPTLNRLLPELMKEYEQKKQSNANGEKPEDPPISLAGVIAERKASGKIRYIPATKWAPPDDEEFTAQSPTRRFYLQSILSPSEWRILSDLILVYPYISEAATNKFLAAMKRLAPGVRNWSGHRYAQKTPAAMNFEHIEMLDNAIKHHHKVSLQYGKYKMAFDSNTRRWHPELQLMEKNNGRMVVDPYAMMWSNGYYYLVCRDGDIMRNLRVDRIMQVLPTTAPFEIDTNFDPYQYRDRSPVMYPGEPTLIRMKCSVNRISTLMDFFGTAILDYSVSSKTLDETTVTLRASEKGVRLFALQYADDVEVLDPPSLRDEVAKTLQSAAEKYR